MSKLINSIMFAIVAITGNAQAQAQPGTFKLTMDDRAEDVRKANKRYHKDRNDYTSDMLQLIKSDKGEVLARRPRSPAELRKGAMAEFDAKNKNAMVNQWHFNTARVPEEALRSVGMASDLRLSRNPNAYWAFSDRSPKDFEAMYGAPAYSVASDFGSCYLPAGPVPYFPEKGDLRIGTYIDVDKDGNNVEIHVHTCKYSEGPFQGNSIVVAISPIMATVDYSAKFMAYECRVRSASTIGDGRGCKEIY